MKNDRFMAGSYFFIALLFAFTSMVGAISNPLLWLAAMIFLGLGIFRLVRIFKN